MNAALRKHDVPVSVTPALRRKLLEAFNKRFQSIDEFLQQWSQQSDSLGSPPPSEVVQSIIYSVKRGTCPHWIINGLCHLLLDRPYRDNSAKHVPDPLKQKLFNQFKERFKAGQVISWAEFSLAWGERFNDSDPPRRQTIRSFLESEHRHSCEHWLIDGLCQLLLNCSFDTLTRSEAKKELICPGVDSRFAASGH